MEQPTPTASTSGHNLPSPNPGQKKHRTSLLVAASDALGFGRVVNSSFGKRISKRNSEDQSATLAQQRKGLPWKGKGRAKGQWALQPATSSPVSDVIEISAASGASLGIYSSSAEEKEELERERLREAAAESIGLSPFMREGSSSKLTGNDSVAFEDTSFEGLESKEDLDDHRNEERSPAEVVRSLDKSWTSLNGTVRLNGFPAQVLPAREMRHFRSSSVSGLAIPSAEVAAGRVPSPALPPSSFNGRPLTSPAPSQVAVHVPPFPCLHCALDPFSRRTSTILKHFSSSSLLLLGLSRQWRPRHMVLSVPQSSFKSFSSNLRPSTPSRGRNTCFLHLFKSPAPDERELERIEINEDSIVCISEEDVAGKSSVIKIGGIDVGGKRKESLVDEDARTMWFIHIEDQSEAQGWISTLKSVVLEQRYVHN